MLLLRRKIGQTIKITIPPNQAEQIVEVLVCDCSVYHATIGVAAEQVVRVVRKELEEQKQ